MTATQATGWFVYGSLKPGELGFRRIQDFVARHEPATLDDHMLAVRDGLPVVIEKPGFTVRGYLLVPLAEHVDDLTAAIASFENPQTYKTDAVTVHTTQFDAIAAFTNKAKYPGHGSPDRINAGVWGVADDLLLRHGLPVLFQQAHGPWLFGHDSEDPAFWKTYLPAMGTVLNLWAVFERYVAFAQPAAISPMASVSLSPPTMQEHLNALEASDIGARALEQVTHLPKERIFRATSVRRSARQHRPWETWYTVRNNAAHRGKSAFRDAQLVQDTAMGLSEALVALLSEEVPPLGCHYRNLGLLVQEESNPAS